MAIKYDDGKPDFTLIPQKALLEVAKVATSGAAKYPNFNYSNEKSVRRYTSAALRHINQFLSGEDLDEIGTHHLANASMSLLMVLDNILNGTVEDDRNVIYQNRTKKDSFPDIYITGVGGKFPNGDIVIQIDRGEWKGIPNIYTNFEIKNQKRSFLAIKPKNNYIPKVGDKLE